MAKRDWSWLKGKYPSLSDAPEHDEVIAAAMEVHRSKSIEELAAQANTIEDEKADVERTLAGINAELTAIERLMERAFEATSVEKIVIGGYAFSPSLKPTAKITDPVAWLAWVNEEMPEILMVHAGKRDAIVALALEAGEDVPPGIEVNVRTSISRRKSN